MPVFSSTQPSLRARILAKFPARVVAGSGINIVKSGGTYTFSVIAPISVPVTVSALPPAASNQGVRRMVSDATAITFWSIVVGGGANIVPVTSDGTNWRIG
jgi:hypothetical protein